GEQCRADREPERRGKPVGPLGDPAAAAGAPGIDRRRLHLRAGLVDTAHIPGRAVHGRLAARLADPRRVAAVRRTVLLRSILERQRVVAVARVAGEALPVFADVAARTVVIRLARRPTGVGHARVAQRARDHLAARALAFAVALAALPLRGRVLARLA